MHTAFLLAAGFGTRLRPLTLARPKPLMPMCGVAMLDLALAHVRAHGHEEVLVNAHHLWEQVAAWAERNGGGLQVELPDILGTGGGLRAARERLAERFVVVNADVLSDVDLTALLGACDAASMALRPSPDAERIGPVLADEHGVVTRITTVVPGGGLAGTHFTGVHALSRDALDLVPLEGEQCIVRTAYKALVPERRVRAIRHEGAWVDVGTPQAYLKANLDALAGRLVLPVDPWSRGERGPGGSWLGEGARVDGEVERCVVGAHAHVPSGARLVDSVVWDGATAPDGEHERAVIYDGSRVLLVG